MSFSLAQVLLFVAIYLALLFAVAHLADRGIIPRRITHHPATYVLSLGVFAGAMATNGVVEVAHRYGYNFIIYYLGVVVLFVFSTLLLIPLLRLSRVYQLTSLADMLSFRFRDNRVGAAVTLAMCIALLPLLALQIQAVGDSIHLITGNTGMPAQGGVHHRSVAALTCLVILVFAMLFGARNLSSQARNEGLVVAVAFQSLVKLVAMLALMAVAIFGVFGGYGEMQQWLHDSPLAQAQLLHRMPIENTHALILVFFAGGVCMPHAFHMLFAENMESRDLRVATWGLPMYLMLLSLPVLPVAWAGMQLGSPIPMEYAGIAIGRYLDAPMVSAAALLATLSAASATIVVATLALANMCLNHLILPLGVFRLSQDSDIYRHLRWLRRGLITVLILAGYLFYVSLENRQSLVELAWVAFSGTLQFLPGVVATPYWPNANRRGLLAGLCGGLGFWVLAVMLPVTRGYMPEFAQLWLPEVFNSDDLWSIATMLALAINVALFVVVSLLSPTTEEERVAAEVCSMDDLSRPVRQLLSLANAGEFTELLSPALGERTARAEVERALEELQFTPQESRPYALRRLLRRIEANLSGLLGPAVAHNIIERCIPIQAGGNEDINLIERFLDASQTQFTGLAADLDALRRRYRETLDTLPVGICSMGADGEMLMWNRAMQTMTGIRAGEVLGSLVTTLPAPWGALMAQFSAGDSDTLLREEVASPQGQCWISLHRSTTAEGDTMILVEDITDFERMEEELLHSERLASIGRLAAGVAHEIGNPVTAIACLAQNLEYAEDPAEVSATAEDILRQTERVTRIVESLVNFSHAGSQAESLELKPCNLADCVDEAIHLLCLDREARQVRFENLCDREMLVLADSQRLLQVFVNLLGNARDACGDDGHITARAYPRDNRVLVDVEDNGHGIPPHLHSQVFEPFFTTKDPGSGTGLGLALVYSIMDDLGGAVQLSSPLQAAPNPGTRFSLDLASASYGDDFEL
ncbi:PAS domain-containing protein [Mangrovimicrobium sediminis]|uniref:histidine kinase n=1 Tax=Mangrovimicrobium sediminis TaxID=2562682 RepID=A0A4Z0LUW9_9GAMM|nr:ATP-binding protein [Haliea sp. SAOS-164]TGD70928.1 PAS domain-containing protein [Haliea sp. SAOS-164]